MKVLRKTQSNDSVQDEKRSVGMSAVEMVLWLLAMAALSIAMIWLLWNASR